jgi:ribosomal-protein-alanine N-acetyltransferase
LRSTGWACIASKPPAAHLLTKAGFEGEGQAKGYLKINGVWRDHLLFGMVRPGD